MYHNYYQPVQSQMYRPYLYPCMMKRWMYQHQLMPYYINNNPGHKNMLANQPLYSEQLPQQHMQGYQNMYPEQPFQQNVQATQPVFSTQQGEENVSSNEATYAGQHIEQMTNQQENSQPNMFTDLEASNEAAFSHQFLNEHGQVDVNKMLSTVGHLAQTVQQVSPVIKQVNDIIQSFRV